jgi:hypothetical protein
MRRLTPFLAATLLACAACSSASDLGTGANTVTRGYLVPLPRAWSAAIDCTQAAELTIVSDRHGTMRWAARSWLAAPMTARCASL